MQNLVSMYIHTLITLYQVNRISIICLPSCIREVPGATNPYLYYSDRAATTRPFGKFNFREICCKLIKFSSQLQQGQQNLLNLLSSLTPRNLWKSIIYCLKINRVMHYESVHDHKYPSFSSSIHYSFHAQNMALQYITISRIKNSIELHSMRGETTDA